MMRSLYSAVSGLKTHQTRMDVIGNNISNVNTEAFKASQVTFSEIMYQNKSKASGGNVAQGIGGVNAKQIGLGVSMASTTVTIESSGAAETTGNPFDLRLTDSQTTNFFIVSDGTSTKFTRAGSFYVDGNGFLAMVSTGYTLMGWQVDNATGEIRKDTVSALRVMAPENLTSAPEKTTEAYVSGVLDKNDTDVKSESGYVMTVGIFDDLGYPYTAKFAVKPATETVTAADGTTSQREAEGRYNVTLSDILDQNGKSIVRDGEGNLLTGIPTLENFFQPATIEYDTAKGTFIQVTSGGTAAAAGTAPSGNAYALDADGNRIPYVEGTTVLGDNQIAVNGYVMDSNKVMLNLSYLDLPADGVTADPTDGLDDTERGTLQDPATNFRSNFGNIAIDFSLSMNYNNGGVSSMKMLRGDKNEGLGSGKKFGNLTGLTVDNSGKIYGTYDNGNTELLCQISTTQFANASGLEKVGENCYQTTLNSGEFDGIGMEITNDGSKITTGEIEMSNVDLSSEFTGMIVTQRGFQANSRVITTSDSLLEELINLKR